MAEEKFYIVKKKAVPEVLLQVVEAKRLLDSERAMTVQEATEQVDISRSSFYKYKDDIFPFHDNAEGKTITFTCEMEDEPGILSDVLRIIAEFGANILTIHQSIPINNMATLSISLQILSSTKDLADMMGQIETHAGVRAVKVLARE